MHKMFKVTRFALLTWFVSTSAGYAQNMPPPKVEIITAEQKVLAPSMQLKGNVLALQDAVISAEVEGKLNGIAHVGSQLLQGQQIAQLDKSRLVWTLSRDNAQLEALRSDLAFRKTEVERFERLASQDNAAKNQLQRERAAMFRLEQEIIAANALVLSAEKAVNDAVISAPFDGVIAERFAHLGEYIRVGDPLVRFVNPSLKDLSIPVPIKLLELLKPGMNIQVMHEDHSHEFAIRQVVPIGDPASRMVEMRLNVSDSHLTIGDSVTAQVPLELEQSVVVVPRDAVVIRGNQRFVYKVNGDNVAEQVQADIRFADGPWVVLQSGVEAGDKIIIRGAERLQPNTEVVF
ncbi:efflux RND transporter periplasmic adaptor subunit [Alteromonas facilis]|uniref:efflux RND transporter periplasmic adaptor subunit n=1 Tax=Alteromonas facilis TaxID=2048004 RepID=UPI000C28AE02|nr:efflux RND transporter periplasmic adaptor subunit [Alteromonas facilis]